MDLVEYTAGGVISKPYSVFSMGSYGTLIFVLLCIGIVVWLVFVTIDFVTDLFMRSGTLLRAFSNTPKND